MLQHLHIGLAYGVVGFIYHDEAELGGVELCHPPAVAARQLRLNGGDDNILGKAAKPV